MITKKKGRNRSINTSSGSNVEFILLSLSSHKLAAAGKGARRRASFANVVP